MNGLGGSDNGRALPALSEREHQLLELAAQGHTDAAIAHALGISPATVNAYWTRLRGKLGARSRTEAVALSLTQRAEANLRRLRAENERLQARVNGLPKGTVVTPDVLESTPDGVFVTTVEGVIMACNRALEDMLGYGIGELQGRHVSELIPERLREDHTAHLAEFVLNPERKRMGHGLFVPALRKDGGEIAVAVTLGSQDGPGGLHVVGMVRDYTQELVTLLRFAPKAVEETLLPAVKSHK